MRITSRNRSRSASTSRKGLIVIAIVVLDIVVAGEGVDVDAAAWEWFEGGDGAVVAAGEAVEALANGGFGDAEHAGDLALGVVLFVAEVPGLEFAVGVGAGHGWGEWGRG
jgi:hypothetical protein